MNIGRSNKDFNEFNSEFSRLIYIWLVYFIFLAWYYIIYNTITQDNPIEVGYSDRGYWPFNFSIDALYLELVVELANKFISAYVVIFLTLYSLIIINYNKNRKNLLIDLSFVKKFTLFILVVLFLSEFDYSFFIYVQSLSISLIFLYKMAQTDEITFDLRPFYYFGLFNITISILINFFYYVLFETEFILQILWSIMLIFYSIYLFYYYKPKKMTTVKVPELI